METRVVRTADLELITIYEISKLLSSSIDFSQAARGVLNVLLGHLQMHRGMISLVQQSDPMHLVCAASVSPAGDKPITYGLGEGISGRILRSGMPMVVPDISKEPLFLNRAGRELAERERVAFVGVPIKGEGRTVGVLSVDRRAGSSRPINFERDVRILTLVANLIGQTYLLHQRIAADRQGLMEEKFRLQKELKGKYDLANIVGRSKRMQEVFADVHQAAPGNATILLRGESGTGKEVIAHAIHYLSPRKNGPFVKLNCAALPESLLESELFGHEKGAFTGAAAERKGRFELADGGTLFLDEIGDVSPAFQAKLLRVLQEREFERVGGNRTLRTDFRLVTATNRNLEELVKNGQFRADLYFRINVVTIFMPPLRERREDIALLADHFLEHFNEENRRKLAMVPEAVEVLVACNWPGNVRELENCVERTATMTRGNAIRPSDLRCHRGQCFSSSVLLDAGQARRTIPIVAQAAPVPASPLGPAGRPCETPDEIVGEALSERDRLIGAMEKCGWVQAKAARLLDMTPRQIGYALKKYNIPVKRL
jgi:Nif-specific regulatory protein